MTRSTGLCIPWCCLSMIYEVFFYDNYHPLFFVVRFSAAYHDDRHVRTMTACNAWRLTVKVPDVRRGYRPIATHICLFYSLCMIFSFSIWFKSLRRIRLSRSTVNVQLSRVMFGSQFLDNSSIDFEKVYSFGKGDSNASCSVVHFAPWPRGLPRITEMSDVDFLESYWR